MSIIGDVRIEIVYQPKRLVEYVEALRKKKGMTRSDLARASGVAWNSIKEIELGTLDPRASTMDKLLSALGYELHPVEKSETKEEGQE